MSDNKSLAEQIVELSIKTIRDEDEKEFDRVYDEVLSVIHMHASNGRFWIHMSFQKFETSPKILAGVAAKFRTKGFRINLLSHGVYEICWN